MLKLPIVSRSPDSINRRCKRSNDNQAFLCGEMQAGESDFNTIQQAVTAVPPGSTINVCPGNCAEQVVIQQPLTLQGSTKR
jgi:pectin methylesterase-like acyl-CoA thioesterase